MRHLSPALRHQARILAEQSAASSAPGQPTSGSAYELQLYQLAEHKRALKTIQSIKGKIAHKATLLPEYQAWIEGVLAAGNGGQDDVLTTLLVWSIDVGEFDRALEIARYAVLHKMTLPDQYSRDIPTMLLDEFAGAYLHKNGGGMLAKDPRHAVDVLGAIGELTQDSDVPDQARAKLHKALGYALLAVANNGKDDKVDFKPAQLAMAKAANLNLKRALTLFEGVGVKKDIERLERRLKKAPQG
ncbi:phage terminase small subunit [Glaciimonas sp. PCH181]|uniref:phage terminase small subunit n=1 Tax=Glaciimonas sp. PCH181 TaxID=2133943 RepID=UPI000D33391E|nr:phage terminase small subunit [Glaciimonas sp. PCH181]PUA16812.1 integrase [Glaciimonas sp. PCH181]